MKNKPKEVLKMVTEKNKIIAKAEEKRKYLTGEAERERLQQCTHSHEYSISAKPRQLKGTDAF